MGSSSTPPRDGTATDDCTITGSFADHGLRDGTDLITRTYYRLAGDTRPQFEPASAFFECLESAFRWTYLASIDEPEVPEHVEAAIDDARVLTYEEFYESPSTDLRLDVIPSFYQRVAGFHCAYRD